MSQEFSSYYGSLRNRALFRWVDVRKRAAIRAYVGKRQNLQVLDLGCGSAAVSSAFVRDNNIFGVDPDAALLETARQRGLSTSVGTFESIPFDAGRFDIVLMIDTLEHVDSRERTLAEVRRVLAANGGFLAITPNYASPLWNVAEPIALRLSGRNASGHVSPFTGESLRYWLERSFSTVTIDTLNLGMWLCGIGEAKRETG
jgi:ubiquinone/menaquinone biosynthesis C-methylase UbiE